MNAKNKVKASDHESYNSFTLIAVVVPVVAFILGIVYLTKDRAVDKKLGEHLIAISILLSIIYWFLWGWYISGQYGL